jgi:ribose-phosphate pyrophosphokinase
VAAIANVRLPANQVISLELHDAQYQGFLDCPFDNLYGRPLLQRYIQLNIPDYREAVIVSPDAGGAKRATQIADALSMEFALIHKVMQTLGFTFRSILIFISQERRPTKFAERRNATMMLVGDVSNRVCILVDDLADTANTITRGRRRADPNPYQMFCN